MATVIPKISRLSKCIIRVLGCNPGPMTLQGTNTYIIGTGKRRLLFDTGEQSNKEYLSNLCDVLKENNCKLDTIIISHWHHDHIGGLEDVLHSNLDSQVVVMKLPRSDQTDVIPPTVSSKVSWLKGDEEIKVEGATLRVHHTPGHTTDHVVLKLEEEDAVFSGDCILGEGTAVFEDLSDYMKSLKAILDLQPSIIYPGHGPVITDPMHRIRYYIEHRNEREAQILNALQQTTDSDATPMSLVRIIYKDTPAHLHVAASGNVLHHLTKLEKEEKVVCVDQKNSLWRLRHHHVSNL